MANETVPFAKVIGHEAIRNHLMGALKSGHLSHAYILEGMNGVGRRTLLNEFLKALFCTENRDENGAVTGEGCGKCVACATVTDGNHPDVRRIKPLADKKMLSVSQLREELVRDISIRPYTSDYKVYVIENAETMTPESQNAILKTIEEPPAYGLIFLITESASSMLPTILSRCVRLSFQPLSPKTVHDELLRRRFTEEQAAVGAAFSGGSLGQALTLCGDEDFVAMRRDVYDLLAEIPSRSAGWLLLQEKRLEAYKNRKDTLLNLVESWFRDVLVFRETADKTRVMSGDYQAAIASAAEYFDTPQLSRILWTVTDLKDKTEQNANFSLAMDCLLLAIRK